LIEANKVMNEKIDSYPFNDPMKMNLKEGFSEVELDTNSSAMRLMNEFEKIIEINQEVIKLIEKNNGKMIKKEGKNISIIMVPK
jgi:heme oxygenase